MARPTSPVRPFTRPTSPVRPFTRRFVHPLLIALSLSVSTSCGTDAGDETAPVGPEGTITGAPPAVTAPISTNGATTGNAPVTAPGNTTVTPMPQVPGSGATGAPQANTSTNDGAGGATGGGGAGGEGATGSTVGGLTSDDTGSDTTTGDATGDGTGDTTTGATTTETDTSGSSNEADPSTGSRTSTGCGSQNPLQSGTFTVDIEGTERSYILEVPAEYDANTAYRLIFVWHPLGGSANQVKNGGYDGLMSRANGSAIFVAPDGTDGGNAMVSGQGWWNEGDKDMKFFSALFEELTAGLCVDEARVFSTGFSFGGMISYTLGTQFDVFRAIAPTSGNLAVIPREDRYMGPLAVMAFHGDNDTFVLTEGGREAMDHYRARNNCESASQPVDPSPCVEYQGCAEPTIWCEYPGAHSPWDQMPEAVWTFFSQF